MTAFIFFISFLLHIIAFIAIAQLLRQLKQLKEQNYSQDIMDVFETYLQEIKEENRILEEKLTNVRPHKISETAPTTIQTPIDSNENKADNPDYPVPEIEADDTSETSLQAKILQLHSQGLSQGEIAKKLNCGNTETELIIKLHAKKTNN